MTRPVPILLYHSIADEPSSKFEDWTVPVKAFDQHMQYLAAQDYTTFTITELAQRMGNPQMPLPEKTVAVTFDDGLADFYTSAYPTLKRYHIASTMYVPTAYVGHTSRWLKREGMGDYPVMHWDQILELAGNGVEFGGHSHHHVQLDLMPHDEAQHEISRCRMEMEEHLKRPIETFAYPHGYYSAAVRELVVKTGYTSACGVKNALSSMDDDRFALARVIVTPRMNVEQLGRILSGRTLAIAPGQERRRTRVWRHARSVMAQLDRIRAG